MIGWWRQCGIRQRLPPARKHSRPTPRIGRPSRAGAGCAGPPPARLNPYDGHTLKEALEQVAILTNQRPDLAVVDRGYRGHGVEAARVLISGKRRGLTPKRVADLRRRSAIEAEIGHMKTDVRLSRCLLKGTNGDALFAVLCACGHNIRKILAIIWAAIHNTDRQHHAVTAA